MTDHPEAAGPVVLAPDRRRGRPAPGHVTPVRVHRRCGAPGQLLGGVELAGQEAPTQGRQRGTIGRVRHQGHAALDVPQARVHMARRPDVVHRPLGHEGGRPPFLGRDLLDPVLEHQVPVRRRQRLVVGDVDLVLAPARLPLGELDRDVGGPHFVADAAQDVLLARRLQQLVVLDGRRVGGQSAPTRLGRRRRRSPGTRRTRARWPSTRAALARPPARAGAVASGGATPRPGRPPRPAGRRRPWPSRAATGCSSPCRSPAGRPRRRTRCPNW